MPNLKEKFMEGDKIEEEKVGEKTEVEEIEKEKIEEIEGEEEEENIMEMPNFEKHEEEINKEGDNIVGW